MEQQAQSTGRGIDDAVVTRFGDFFENLMRDDINKLLNSYPQKKSLFVDVEGKLVRFDETLVDGLLEEPDAYVRCAEEAVGRRREVTNSGEEFRPHVRFFNLPRTSQVEVLSTGAEHLDKLIQLEGVISSISEIKPRMVRAAWECNACRNRIYQDAGKVEPLTAPTYCTAPGCTGPSRFTLIEPASIFVDMQGLGMQDPVEKMRGNMPTVHAELWFEDDLTNTVAPGDKVMVTGILRLKPVTQNKAKSSVYHKFVDVNSVQKVEVDFEDLQITKEEEREIVELSRDPRLVEKVVASIAPSIFGYNELKKAIALQLFGGTPGKILPDGESIRSDAHLLLIGDPGTSKSTMLEYVSRLAPKCIVVSGGGASGVGLTASAEKNEITGGWIMKAGAMVLANGGLVGIDEMDKMKEEDRAAIHQAMEQQKISVAKAGIVTQFQSKTAVLAAANPKQGRFDPNTPIASQFALTPTLLSRFDLIFAMRDTLDEKRDRDLAAHILEGHRYAGSQFKKGSVLVPAVDPELLRKYISYARRNIAPELTQEASDKIREYYVELRKAGKEQNTFTVTARQIEGLIRLSEAHAKLRLSRFVELQDAQAAIDLADFVLHEIYFDRETGRIDSDIVNLGQPKSKLDKIRNILNIIAALEKEFDLVEIDAVVREAASYGLDEPYTRKLIEELMRQGDLYAPKPGHVKQARGREW